MTINNADTPPKFSNILSYNFFQIMGPPHLGQRKPTTVARNINNFQPFVHSRRSHNTLYKIKPTKYFFKNHISHCTAGDVVLAAKASCHWGCSLPKFGPKKFSTEAWSNQVHQKRLVQTKGSAQKFGPNTVQHQKKLSPDGQKTWI